MSGIITRYRRAVDGFDALVGTVGAADWDRPSMCAEWTVRDVMGHVVWGQRLTRGWAAADEYTGKGGAPGAPCPGSDELAGADPVAAWREARAACDAALTPEGLSRRVVSSAFGEIAVENFVELLVTDFMAHTFDIGHALGRDVRLAPELIPVSLAWVRDRAVRRPGGIGPELTPPDDADEQTRYLAFLGRKAW